MIPSSDVGLPLGSHLTALVAATWAEVPGYGYVPVLAWWPSTDSMPDDQVRRRVLLAGDGQVYQIPIDFSPRHIGDA